MARSTSSAYDGGFVALARGLGVPLVTLDAKPLRELPDVAVSPEQFDPAAGADGASPKFMAGRLLGG